MLKNLALNKLLYFVTGILAVAAAVKGVILPQLYEPVVSAEIMPGVFTQDIFVIIAAVIMIIWPVSKGMQLKSLHSLLMHVMVLPFMVLLLLLCLILSGLAP